DMTSGCTKQACSFAELQPEFEACGAVIIGISKDTSESHQRFISKYNLPFTLLSDPDHSVMELYGVWQEKMMYGKKTMGTVRSTFLIDETGMITGIYRKVKADRNPSEMLEALTHDEIHA
ncbi:MAG: peroxiredoxin, partial [Clostridia bacterium]|nr:peroxiredoxin [Clostridia bacterium]